MLKGKMGFFCSALIFFIVPISHAEKRSPTPTSHINSDRSSNELSGERLQAQNTERLNRFLNDVYEVQNQEQQPRENIYNLKERLLHPLFVSRSKKQYFATQKKATCNAIDRETYIKHFSTKPDGSRIILPRSSVGAGQIIKFSEIPKGHLVGTFGAGPCIGVMIYKRDPQTGQIIESTVAHFNAMNHPSKDFSQMTFPAGSEAIVFGGDNSNESNAVLGSVLRFLENKKTGISSIQTIDSPDLWINSAGELYCLPFN
jgi:hypothetical protein